MTTGKDRIIITHYINPTMFWFKYQTDECLPLLSHETALQAFANSIDSVGHHPVLEEVVLVKHLAMDKWVRCKVDKIEISDIPEYTVWVIDYGYVSLYVQQRIIEICSLLYVYSQPLRTQAKWILPLDTDLALFDIPLIYKAGLANIVPAVTVSHFITFVDRYYKISYVISIRG